MWKKGEGHKPDGGGVVRIGWLRRAKPPSCQEGSRALEMRHCRHYA